MSSWIEFETKLEEVTLWRHNFLEYICIYIHSSIHTNSLIPGRSKWNFKQFNFKVISIVGDWYISYEIALRLLCLLLGLNSEKSTLVRVMAWRQPRHRLSECYWRIHCRIWGNISSTHDRTQQKLYQYMISFKRSSSSLDLIRKDCWVCRPFILDKWNIPVRLHIKLRCWG